MNIRFGILLSTLVIAPAVFSQPGPALSESTSTALEAKLGDLKTRYGVEFTFDLNKVPKPTWKQGMRRVAESESAEAARYVDLFITEFSKYPVSFIKASRLKAIVFCAELDINGQRRTAAPDYVNEVGYYDILAIRSDLRYARHVVHHEFYHMLEQEWNKSAYFKDPAWAKLNPPEFKYGTGGVNARGNLWTFNHPSPGFINHYSQAGLEEDKAEVWATMFVPESWAIVEPWLAEDKVLKAKFDFLQRFAESKSPEMDAEFWKKLIAPAPQMH